MTDEIEVVRGSGNIFEDLGMADADVRQAKALMAAEIIKILDNDDLSTRQAEARTGISHSEFSRIRRVNLKRFTIDRLMQILHKLGRDVEVSVVVRKARQNAIENAAHP
jgi:predicted XRE-type DNA-binding protein